MSFIHQLIDRCLFTIIFIMGIQCPAFLTQYIQQLSGRLEEAKWQLSQYQTLADMHFNGSLSKLTEHYLSNSDTIINKTGMIVNELINRRDYLTFQFTSLHNQPYLEQLWFFSTNFDDSIVQQTYTMFSLSIPLTIEALCTGFFIAILVMSLLKLCLYSCSCIYQRMFKQVETN
ncbi:DUF2937 family protein [Thalassotalea hakodatensis]|uniref:DUF2937 family protein n=1 Tax=Thalassotalea hakodatensis TaxID=3030492 RepID=UPI0025724B28|nr:DUF2937 family protein [Thalassotalea hakodatensis]